MSDDAFSEALLHWYDLHGRRDLPWKRAGDAYAVWVSEIMLQQTQVTTVIPYYERFMFRFPTVATLARANLDDVLSLWTGLGYYARARNLHRAAAAIMSDHGGVLPRDLAALEALPGIGRSTAGAILALANGDRHPILDGNVKRVLARYHAVDEPVNSPRALTRLWTYAERLTPHARVADYTQAIMDLGSTVCRRANPACDRCPVASGCAARAGGDPLAFPVPARRRQLPVREVHMLLIEDTGGRVLLLRRPPAGLWGGLWGLPECPHGDIDEWCRRTLGLEVSHAAEWPKLRHTFTHFHLDITPVRARIERASCAMQSSDARWYTHGETIAWGMPAPVVKLLERLRTG